MRAKWKGMKVNTAATQTLDWRPMWGRHSHHYMPQRHHRYARTELYKMFGLMIIMSR